MASLTGYAPPQRIPNPTNPEQTFAGLKGALPKEMFFNQRARDLANSFQDQPFAPLVPIAQSAPDVTGGHGHGGLIGQPGASTGSILRNAALGGILTNTGTIADMVRGRVPVGQGLTGIAGNIGDLAAYGLLDRATGQPVSTFAPLAGSLISAVSPAGSIGATVGNWLAHPVTSAINAVTGAGGSAAATTAASGGAAASGVGSAVLSGLGTAVPLAAAGFALAGLGNQLLGSDKGERMATFMQEAGIQAHARQYGRMQVGYYQLPDGRWVDQQHLDQLYQRAKGWGTEDGKRAYEELLQSIQTVDPAKIAELSNSRFWHKAG